MAAAAGSSSCLIAITLLRELDRFRGRGYRYNAHGALVVYARVGRRRERERPGIFLEALGLLRRRPLSCFSPATPVVRACTRLQYSARWVFDYTRIPVSPLLCVIHVPLNLNSEDFLQLLQLAFFYLHFGAALLGLLAITHHSIFLPRTIYVTPISCTWFYYHQTV